MKDHSKAGRYVDLSYVDINATKFINEKLARRYTVMPITYENQTLLVAVNEKSDFIDIEDLKLATNLEIIPVICSTDEILSAINQYYGKEATDDVVAEFKRNFIVEEKNLNYEENKNHINTSPIVKLINSIIEQAVHLNASDIHIEPNEGNLRIRFRVDGSLQEFMSIDKAAHPAIISRIKIISNMDISEKRLPQDGRTEVNCNDIKVDIRISTILTIYGEKIVMRLIYKDALILLEDLGLTERNFKSLSSINLMNSGMVLIVGPAGSGKSTTLYSVLRNMDSSSKNIITIEDPVEYTLSGVNQIQINHKAGMNFSNGLRSILRQDPDVIMIGEIRDMETAEIAVGASITGHIVLSTLHTKDTTSAITRLMDMGIKDYLISSSLSLIVAQRLVKKICTKCKQEYKSSIEDEKLLKKNEAIILYKGTGCSTCNHTGYRGRSVVQEIMKVNTDIREMIHNCISTHQIHQYACDKGMVTLQEACRDMVISGLTTIEEFFRLFYAMENNYDEYA